MTKIQIHSICKHHMMYLSKYHLQLKKCCDPLVKHIKPKTGSVEISILQADRWALNYRKPIIPGYKIYCGCWHLLEALGDEDTTSASSFTESKEEPPLYSTMDIIKMNKSFELCSVSPLKRQVKSKGVQVIEAKHKIIKSANALLGNVEHGSP